MGKACDIEFNPMRFLMNQLVPSSRSNSTVVALFPETVKCSGVLPFLSFSLTLAPFASKKLISFVLLAFFVQAAIIRSVVLFWDWLLISILYQSRSRETIGR